MKIFLLFCILSLSFLLNSQASAPDSLKNSLWERQLEQLKDNQADGRLYPQLIRYKYIGEVGPEEDIELVKQNILGEDSVLPYVADNKLYILTWKEAAAKDSEAILTLKTFLNAIFDKTVKSGLKKIEIEWQNKGHKFKTLCLAYDEEGIIYDNIITNLFLKSETTETTTSATIE